MNSLTFYIERDLGPFDQREYALDVTYQVSRYYPATHLQPAEGGDCEIMSVQLDGEEFELTQAEEDRLQEACLQDGEGREADRGDYLYEQQRDRQMMDAWEQGV